MFPQWMKRHELLFTHSTSQLMNWVEWALGVLEKMFLFPVLLVTCRTSVTCGNFINSPPKHNLRSISQQPSKSLWKREKENAIKLTNFTQREWLNLVHLVFGKSGSKSMDPGAVLCETPTELQDWRENCSVRNCAETVGDPQGTRSTNEEGNYPASFLSFVMWKYTSTPMVPCFVIWFFNYSLHLHGNINVYLKKNNVQKSLF